VFAWRRQARAGLLVLLSELAVTIPREPPFVPIVTEAGPPFAASSLPSAAPAVSTIEVEVAGAIVRVQPGIDGTLLTTVLQALRASAATA
jgi:transposase